MRYFVLLTMLLMCLVASSLVVAQEKATNGSRKIIEKTDPAYPSLARRNGLTGAVKLRVTVAPDGKATGVTVVGGNPVFVQSATESVSKWKWAAATEETKVVVEVDFNPGK